MTTKKIPFSPPRIDAEIINEVNNCLKSGWITTGPRTKALENELTQINGNAKTLCVNSATNGMELILRWFGIKPGDEVIIPAYTYCATANVVIHCGAKPIMVDISDDFTISVEAIKRAITSKTKAIIPVDIAGYPCDYNAIFDLINNSEIKQKFVPASSNQKKLGRILIMSDAAHSLGATYYNLPTGSLTDITVFSFHAVKNLTTAEGGAIALNLPQPFDNELIYKKLNTLSLHGQSKDALEKTTIGGWRYDVVAAGYKCNMPDVLASIGLVEIKRYKHDMINKRKHIFNLFQTKLKKYKWAILPTYKTAFRESSYHLFLLRINNCTENQRDAIIDEIYKNNVSVNVHFQPLPMLSFYKKLGYSIDSYPNAFKLYVNEISLPVYYSLTDEDIEIVCNTVINSVEKILHA